MPRLNPMFVEYRAKFSHNFETAVRTDHFGITFQPRVSQETLKGTTGAPISSNMLKSIEGNDLGILWHIVCLPP